MQKQVSPAVLIGALVITITVIAFLGYRCLNPGVPFGQQKTDWKKLEQQMAKDGFHGGAPRPPQ